MSPAVAPLKPASAQDCKPEPQADKGAAPAAPKGAVALLQEFVQCARHAAVPQHRAILQWTYDQRIASAAMLEFRATVAFLLDGVPHHVLGGWKTSKKSAQRDVAERALHFYVGKWGEQLLVEEEGQAPAVKVPRACSDMQVLEAFCQANGDCGGHGPEWSYDRGEHGSYAARVQIQLLGVSHKFGGPAKPSLVAAQQEVARRVLWYFQCPGYEKLYGPDVRSPAVSGKGTIPAPPSTWACAGAELEELRLAERKVVVMQVQNRLQRELAKALKPGQGVWQWTYEMDEKDTVLPPLYKATAHVPGLGKTFKGAWARGQREAQVEACLSISTYLDGPREESTMERLTSSGGGSSSTGTPRGTRAPSTTSGGSSADAEEVVERVRWADIEVEDDF